MTTLERRLGELAAGRRLQTLLFALFASLALGLAAIGVYGLLHYAVTQRTHEIGIRMAVGATGRDVLGLVLGHGVRLALAGLGLGLLASLWVMQLLRSLLYGVSATDPLTFAVAPLVLLVVSALASAIPARRAARVDPVEALRYE